MFLIVHRAGAEQAEASSSNAASTAAIQRLEAENAALRQALLDLRTALMPAELEEAGAAACGLL